MNLSEKLQNVADRLNNKVEAIQVSYYDRLNEDACLYYFYYNQNNDPTIISCPEGEKPTIDSVAVSLPSSVHQDLDFRPNKITEAQLPLLPAEVTKDSLKRKEIVTFTSLTEKKEKP